MSHAPVYTILAIDTQPSWVRVFSQMMPADEYEVLFAADGLLALQVLDARKVDVIISEWELPEISGEQLIHIVRSQSRFFHVSIVVYTSKEEESAVAETKRYIDRWFIKYQTDVEELARAVKEQIKKEKFT